MQIYDINSVTFGGPHIILTSYVVWETILIKTLLRLGFKASTSSTYQFLFHQDYLKTELQLLEVQNFDKSYMLFNK
jgi:hypothetical protein